MNWKATIPAFLPLILFTLIFLARPILAEPMPGPENDGLQLLFEVLPHPDTNGEGYDVRVDLLNVTNHDITLHAKWSSEGETRDLKEYVEAAISIETVPEIGPKMVQVVEFGPRVSPQPKYDLKRGEALSFSWHTSGRHLKNKIINEVRTHNPEFPLPGLYSVRATLKINADGRSVSLSSNEQTVPIGGNREIPESTYGILSEVDTNSKTATLGLGSMQQVKAGDAFQIQSTTIHSWKLTITEVGSNHSSGNLELLPQVQLITPTNVDYKTMQFITEAMAYHSNWYRQRVFPKQNMGATLILSK